MTVQIPCVQIFEDLPEKMSSASLKNASSTGTNVAVMRFKTLASLAHFLCFKKSAGCPLHLIDDEGDILVQPVCIAMVYDGPEGKALKSVECKLEIEQDNQWARLVRFMQRYAVAHGMSCGETDSELAIARIDQGAA
ncbi:MAG: photosystem II reaction center protein Psb28 [Leptolyngbyaceae cyanobacterium]